MNKIMNNLSTIVCNDFLSALEITFFRSGRLQEYNESMQLATDLSIIHRLNHWMIEKHDYNDLKLENFLMLVFSWAKIVRNRNKANQRVTILATADIEAKIRTILKKDWWQNHYQRSDIIIKAFSYKNKENILLQEVE